MKCDVLNLDVFLAACTAIGLPTHAPLCTANKTKNHPIFFKWASIKFAAGGGVVCKDVVVKSAVVVPQIMAGLFFQTLL